MMYSQEAFSVLRLITGDIKVYEKDGLVYIEGVNSDKLQDAFRAVWNTSKLGQYIFSKTGFSYVAFHSFFLPDIYYALNKLIELKTKGVSISSLYKIIEGLKTQTWFSSAFTQPVPFLNRTKLNNIHLTPLPHQNKFFDVFEDNIQKYRLNGFLLAAEPGSGKTAMALYIGEMIESSVNIIISPKNAVDLVWKKTFDTFYKDPQTSWVSSDKNEPPPGLRNYAFHYERLDDAVEFARKNKFSNALLWLDESHNLNEMNSIRSKTFIELKKIINPKYTVWASGTPIKAMGREVIPLLRSIDPLFNNDAERRFTEIFGKEASRALDILSHRMGLVMTHITKAEYIQTKPTVTDIKVKVPDSQKYTLTEVRKVIKEFVKEKTEYYKSNIRSFEQTYDYCLELHKKTLKIKREHEAFAVYNTYIKTIRKGYDPVRHKTEVVYCNNYETKNILPSLPGHLKDQFKDAKTVIKYLELKVLGMALGQVLGRLREECIRSLVQYANLSKYIDESEKKTLIFSTYVSVIKEAQEYLTNQGYQPLIVYGETNKDLSGIVKQFSDKEVINPLIATYASLSTAVPLTMANTCVMLNLPFRNHIYLQAISRVDRIGQDTQVMIYHLYLDTGEESNLSTRAGDILSWAKEQVELIMGKKLDGEVENVVTQECFSEIPSDMELFSSSSVLSTW